MRRQTIGFLDVAANEQIEGLIRPSKFEVRLDRDRVIGLEQWVEQLVHSDRPALLGALGEIFAGQHPGHRVPARQLHDILQMHLVEPFGLKADLGLRLIQDFPGLVEVGLRRLVDLRLGELWPRDILARGVTDTRGPVADDQNGPVAALLVAPQRPQYDRVAEVNVRPGWVETELDAQLFAKLDATPQVFAIVDLHRAGGHRIPGAVIKVLSFLHRSVTRSRRRVYTRLTPFTVLF